jgi:nicotinamide-nucleotide amidase
MSPREQAPSAGQEATSARARPSAAIVLSGDELLDGRTRDSNGRLLAGVLSGRGVRVASLAIVGDDRARLAATLRCALAGEPDLLLVGGGLGTTHDDLTAECLADVLGVPLREHGGALEMVAERVRDVAERRGLDFDEVLERARRQARLPAGARPLPPAGVAPGIAAVAGVTRIFAFPGVPWELRRMWAEVEAGLEREGFFPSVVTRLVRLYGAGELQISPVLEACAHDLLWVGINIGAGEVTVILRHEAGEAARAQAAAVVAALEAELPVFSSDGRTVDDLVGEALRARAETVAVAESCTGGLLGARLTARPGSSDYMRGGVIAYANEAKEGLLGVPGELLERHGAVSEQVAAAMAEGARHVTGATWGLGVTGVAGPSGGSPEKPVGLVYVGCAGPGGVHVAGNRFPGDRENVRDWSVVRALHLLREQLGV